MFSGRLPLGPGETENVWRSNTIKHCLVTRHANVEVGGQTVKTCLIKHCWNSWYKLVSNCGAHAGSKHVWYAAVETNKTSPIKHENKRNVLSFWSNVWWPPNVIKHEQTRSNTIKQHQTRCPNGRMLGHQNNVWWCSVAKRFTFVQGLRQQIQNANRSASCQSQRSKWFQTIAAR